MGRFKKAIDSFELLEQAPSLDFNNYTTGCYCGD